MPPDDFPLTVTAFLAEAEKHLRKGDIILSRSPGLVSTLIRKITGSAFSHAALVFLVRDPQDGYNNTFLLESTRRGVGIANLRHYIAGRNPQAEIAVLRFADPDLSASFFTQVRGLMLDHVQAEYDYGRIARLGLAALFGLRLGWARISAGPKRAMQQAVSQTRYAKWLPPQFICSGFIQYGLAKAAVQAGMDTQRVFLREGLTAANTEALLAVTPEDIANSPKLNWLFVARRGWVHRAQDKAQALRLISVGK